MKLFTFSSLKVFFCILLCFFIWSPYLASANKLILYTDNDSYGSTNQEKIWYIAFGDPALAKFLDLKVPTQFFLLDPTGKKNKIVLMREELFDPWFNQKRIAYKTKLMVREQGDYLLCIEGDEFLVGRGKIIKPLAKAVFHVEQELNWDGLCGFELEIKVFTRPYGLPVGALFWGQVLYQGEPLNQGEVEVERLRLKLNPQTLLKDSTGAVNLPLYKKTTKLDQRGYFLVNFEEEGWWVITVRLPRGVKTFGNQNYPFELQSHLWLYVYPFESKKKPKSPRKKISN
ncbi:MAG: DUF4198 domain-containing protein [Caldimicrobium sp.]|nr:DUF4198 domain-containing protein [Caldimicrobium sp.]MCX7874034.1 DUF4198 domain-containing protein [Caldimicrobium sp.]MDW8093858.1 DUF4198 domain-containing protein [Caldimicrobium sp.]